MTVPVPVVTDPPEFEVGPVLKTSRILVDVPLAATSNVAVTLLSASIVTVHVVPVHAPDQPVKVEPGLSCAVRPTEVRRANEVRQTLPQSMPDGFDVTVPVPDPPLETDRVGRIATENVAVTALSPSMVIVHVSAEPEHAPDHAVNVEPFAALAVSMTWAPDT